jgi:hypothetical protein
MCDLGAFEVRREGRWRSRYLNRCIGLAACGCNYVTHICPNETRDRAVKRDPLYFWRP